MTRSKDNQKNNVPQWQSERMKSIIAEKWEEIWEIVEARQKQQN